MANATWVCFSCRVAVRHPSYARGVACPRCGQGLRPLSYKIRLPSENERRAWELLRERLDQERRTVEEQRRADRVRWRHALEQEIVALESRPPNKGRTRAVRLLQRKLNALIVDA